MIGGMLKTILLAIILAASAAANQQARGFCEQGAKVVVTSGINSTTKVQASYPSCTVTVYLTGTLTLATIYSDNSNTPKANPFTANSSGYWFWYAANSRYDVTLSGGGLASPWTISDILLADPAAGSTTVTSVTAGAGITASPNTGAVVVTNTWGAVPTGAQLQYARLKPNTGNNTTWEVASLPTLAAADYNFAAQSPSGTISIGNNLITMTPVPLGVNWNDVGHTLKIAGTGTTEACGIVSAGPGNATSGASTGTLTITCAGAHSAGFTVASANAGGSEGAVVAASLGGGKVVYAGGSFTVYGPIHVPYQYTVWIQGAGPSATVLSGATTFCNPTGTPATCSLATNGLIDFSDQQATATASDAGGVTDLTISFIQPDSTNVSGLYTRWPAGVYAYGNNHVTVRNVIIERAWDGITSPNSNGVIVNNVGMSFFHRGMTFDLAFDVIAIDNFEGWVYGLTSNQSTAFRTIATNNYALDASGCDLITINGFVTDSGKAFKFYKNASNVVPLVLGSNIHMDANGGFEMSNGYVSISKVSASLLTGAAAFSISGGTLIMDGVAIQNNGSTTAAVTYNPSAANTGFAAAFQPGVFISNLQVGGTAEDQQVIYASSSGAFSGTGIVQVRGGTVTRAPFAYTLPLFHEVSGTGTIIMDLSGIKVSNNGSTAAVAVQFQTSNVHSVTGVDAPGGWTYTVPSTTRWFNNTGFTSNFNAVPAATKIAAAFTSSTLLPLIGPNFIAAESGGSANNALIYDLNDAAGVAIPVANGLCITLQLTTHTLQAGANTLNFNSNGAIAIKKHTNTSTNLTVAYAATGRPTVCYSSAIPVWVDMAQ